MMKGWIFMMFHSICNVFGTYSWQKVGKYVLVKHF